MVTARSSSMIASIRIHRCCRQMPLMLPHEVCHHLHRKSKHCGSEAELHKFWCHFKSRSKEHLKWPFMWEETCVPLGLHGDDCRFTDGGQKVICFSMNYLLDETQMRYPLFIIRYETQLLY